MKPAGRGTRLAGFTLVEVLVALAILAIALGALIRGGTMTTANAIYLRDKSFAEWVALNLITEQQLTPGWASVGARKGSAQMAGREWQWEKVVEATEDGDVRRLKVSVGLERDESLVRLVAFLPRPVVK